MDVSTLSGTGMMEVMKNRSTVSSSRHWVSLACSSLDAGRPPVRAAIILSGSWPMQASSSSDRLDSTAPWSVDGREEGVSGGTGVGASFVAGTGVAVGSGSGFGVFGINAGVAAMVPGVGVCAVSGVSAGSEQAARAIRMTRMGNRINFCKWGLLRRVTGRFQLLLDSLMR